MSQLGPLAKTLIGIWLVVWLGNFILQAAQVARDRLGYHPLEVSPAQSPDAFATVRRMPDHIVSGAPRPKAGDRVLRAGDADLRGASQLRFQVLAHDQTSPDLRLPLVLERDGRRIETWVEAWRPPLPWLGLFASLAYAVPGLILILRAPQLRAARFLGAGAMVFSFNFLWITGSSEFVYTRLAILFTALTLTNPLLLTGLLYFPDDARPRGRLALAWPWLFAPLGAATLGYYWDVAIPVRIARILHPALNVGAAVAFAAVLAGKFLGADTVGRRRIKWFLVGGYLALVPHVFFHTLRLLGLDVEPAVWELRRATLAFAPLGALIAVLRFNLFDIDRLVSGTVSYTLLVILLALGGEVLFEPLAGRATSALGMGPAAGQISFVVLLAAVLVPAQRRWRPYVDRIFFSEGVALERGAEELLEQLSDLDEPREVLRHTAEGLEGLFQPAFCGIYERSHGPFQLSVAAGAVDLPGALEATSLEVALATRVAPVLLDLRGSVPGKHLPLPEDLGAVDPAVLVPLRSGGVPSGFLCLGAKRSGDVYTTTDLSLLSAVAHAVSARLTAGEA